VQFLCKNSTNHENSFPDGLYWAVKHIACTPFQSLLRTYWRQTSPAHSRGCRVEYYTARQPTIPEVKYLVKIWTGFTCLQHSSQAVRLHFWHFPPRKTKVLTSHTICIRVWVATTIRCGRWYFTLVSYYVSGVKLRKCVMKWECRLISDDKIKTEQRI
jgi:hypothetical protein